MQSESQRRPDYPQRLGSELKTWTLGGVDPITDFGNVDFGVLLGYGTTFAIDNTSTDRRPGPAAVLLGSFGLGFAGYRLRKRQA